MHVSGLTGFCKNHRNSQNLSKSTNVSIHKNGSYKYLSNSEEMPLLVSFCKILRISVIPADFVYACLFGYPIYRHYR